MPTASLLQYTPMNIKQASSNGQDFNHYLRSLSVPPPFSVSIYKKLNHQKKRDKTPASLQHPMNKTNGSMEPIQVTTSAAKESMVPPCVDRASHSHPSNNLV